MASVTLANYLGVGSSRSLTLALGANGPKWTTYDVGYQGIGNIPWSIDPSKRWSSWNVKDDNSNYYGTITLNCDGATAAFLNYTASNNGYYLEDVYFESVQGKTGEYQVTVAKIIQPGQSSPFPNAPPATPALNSTTQQPIVLSISGTHILREQGAPVLLKGVARPSLEWNPQGQYLSASDVATMRAWGANVIRIPLNQSYWLASQPRTTMGSYRQIVDAMIYYAIRQGMAVILDLHRLNKEQAPMANQSSITFWQDVARTYATFGTILFELYNEPNCITQQQWLSGGNGYVGYQQLYDAVRSVGADNLCIVGGLDWAYDLSFVSNSYCVNGSGVIYCSHPYKPKGDSGYVGQGGSLAHNFAGVVGTFPLIFTEFGGDNRSTYNDGAYYTNVLSYVNSNGVHYTAWAWWVEPSKPEFPTLIGDWSGTPIFGGTTVRADLQSLPGTRL